MIFVRTRLGLWLKGWGGIDHHLGDPQFSDNKSEAAGHTANGAVRFCEELWKRGYECEIVSQRAVKGRVRDTKVVRRWHKT